MNAEQISDRVFEYIDNHFMECGYATDEADINMNINSDFWGKEDLPHGEKISEKEVRDAISSLLSEKKIVIFDWDDNHRKCLLDANVQMGRYAEFHERNAPF
ncbi:hypothetical protein D5039_21550 [Verminephrobacter aporrectodeae subsp. tuberculatae]|uniref:Uncharacterized protein n=1 Tax=Verminephrobacter aporrectodeae subsp. tuberculatae TaxID=1110392 RepID=A0ABT3KZE6_9BURK|nr:hypothetical protein [Verminephrobacter aporrectodeae]MCW5323636.1 hypothetical protein [Verminephrobacter aporrectodeae subsp. tuberculatae]